MAAFVVFPILGVTKAELATGGVNARVQLVTGVADASAACKQVAATTGTVGRYGALPAGTVDVINVTAVSSLTATVEP